MTITQLKYVLAVAEYQNFTKAAENVFVTQPTLSMQIQKLEEELDILIFLMGFSFSCFSNKRLALSF